MLSAAGIDTYASCRPTVSSGARSRCVDRRALSRGNLEPVEADTSVLLDNTTVHGAVAAINAWPPAPAAWTSHPYAANLRSLMDIIEAIILFERIALDSACQALAPPQWR